MNKNLKAKLTSPAPISYDEPAPAPLAVGDRVSAVIYGTPRQGTVNQIGSNGSILFVLWDGTNSLTWMHRKSLTLIPRTPAYGLPAPKPSAPKPSATPLDAQTIAIAALKLIAARPLHHCGNEDDRRVVKIAVNALKDIDALNS